MKLIGGATMDYNIQDIYFSILFYGATAEQIGVEIYINHDSWRDRFKIVDANIVSVDAGMIYWLA